MVGLVINDETAQSLEIPLLEILNQLIESARVFARHNRTISLSDPFYECVDISEVFPAQDIDPWERLLRTAEGLLIKRVDVRCENDDRLITLVRSDGSGYGEQAGFPALNESVN